MQSEHQLEDTVESINVKIEVGLAQLDRGEGIPDEELWERMEVYKATWLANHPDS